MMLTRFFFFLLIAAVVASAAVDPIEATLDLSAEHDDFNDVEPIHVTLNSPDDFEDSPMLSHYGKPPKGCSKDEAWLQIHGVPGIVCAPRCSSKVPCPTDLPEGVTGTHSKSTIFIDTQRMTE